MSQTLPQVDLFASAMLDDPYPEYARLRETGVATYQGPTGHSTVLSHHADVHAVLRDPRFGRAGFRDAVAKSLGDGQLAQSFGLWFLFQDPPDHTRLRGLVSKAFTPQAVERLRARIEELVEDLLDRQRDKASMDLVADYAYQVPVLVICELLGVPAEDRGRFGALSAALAKGLDNITVGDPEVMRQGDEAAVGLTEYFRQLIAIRRHSPGEDLLSGMIVAEQAGDRLSEDELLATCVLLFFAGHETTVNLIGNGMLALLRHPAELQQLREDPSLIVNAVEELLRYDSPVQRTARDALDDFELNGRQFHKNQPVTLLIGAANRDERQFADPDRLDVTRANAGQHLSFASGIHYCVGAPLARIEAQVALNALVRLAPHARLLTDKLSWRPTFVLRGLSTLPVALR